MCSLSTFSICYVWLFSINFFGLFSKFYWSSMMIHHHSFEPSNFDIRNVRSFINNCDHDNRFVQVKVIRICDHFAIIIIDGLEAFSVRFWSRSASKTNHIPLLITAVLECANTKHWQDNLQTMSSQPRQCRDHLLLIDEVVHLVTHWILNNLFLTLSGLEVEVNDDQLNDNINTHILPRKFHVSQEIHQM